MYLIFLEEAITESDNLSDNHICKCEKINKIYKSPESFWNFSFYFSVKFQDDFVSWIISNFICNHNNEVRRIQQKQLISVFVKIIRVLNAPILT